MDPKANFLNDQSNKQRSFRTNEAHKMLRYK